MSIEVDEYVPCHVSTYKEFVGGQYLCVRDKNDATIFEMKYEPVYGIIRDITLTCYNKLTPLPMMNSMKISLGLPILNVSLLKEQRYVAIEQDIHVSVEKNLLIHWGDVGNAKELIAFKDLGFYIYNNELVGCQVSGLSEKQLEAIRSLCMPAS
jgi:hypothetical protein